eukprot:CAMPEP_0179424724 /NCGR_PEP_ID=MMETSP0799-20121207/11760_1 /TAXON_ID=46947 /ORGANISM="Geminigera cryophila, Strain CCMP2564" /LENGTH=42 /DNA_ID= /DNA_START= /DNA_END= /DNA_ORIENTATION=
MKAARSRSISAARSSRTRDAPATDDEFDDLAIAPLKPNSAPN